jgi:hypothetical protein
MLLCICLYKLLVILDLLFVLGARWGLSMSVSQYRIVVLLQAIFEEI